MKNIIGVGVILLFVSTACNTNPEPVKNKTMAMNELKVQAQKSFYDYSAKTLDGEDLDFSSLKGKRVLIVNTASRCGYTPQYKGLQELYSIYGGDDFTIIGFPSNDFMGQEPLEGKEIEEFCTKNYGVEFTMMDKVKVKGKSKHEFYEWLTEKDLNGVDDAKVSWNFNKFLIDENGKWVKHLGSKVEPMSEEIVAFASGK